MTARPVKRSLTLRGHRTSVTLEAPFWEAFRAIARRRGLAIDALASEVDEARPRGAGLASAIRVFVLRQHGGGEAPDALPDGIAEVETSRERTALVARVLDALPGWFGRTDAKARYVAAAAGHTTFAATENGRQVGVLTLADATPDAAEIDVMGVLPEAQGRRHGTRLIAAAEGWARAHGKSVLSVRTVSARHEDEFYARTRAFYRRTGFRAAAELAQTPDLPVPGTLLVLPL